MHADGQVSLQTRFVDQSQALWRAINTRSILLPALFVFLWQACPSETLACQRPCTVSKLRRISLKPLPAALYRRALELRILLQVSAVTPQMDISPAQSVPGCMRDLELLRALSWRLPPCKPLCLIHAITRMSCWLPLWA